MQTVASSVRKDVLLFDPAGGAISTTSLFGISRTRRTGPDVRFASFNLDFVVRFAVARLALFHQTKSSEMSHESRYFPECDNRRVLAAAFEVPCIGALDISRKRKIALRDSFRNPQASTVRRDSLPCVHGRKHNVWQLMKPRIIKL